jgi:hypothetical protein
MDQPLHFSAFIEVQERGTGFNGYPSGKKSRDRVFGVKMKIGCREVILARVADHLLVLPQTVSTGSTDTGKNKRKKVTEVFHGLYFCLIGFLAKGDSHVEKNL